MTKTKEMVAFEAIERDEDNTVIVFARNHVVARRLAAGELGCRFEEVAHCRRSRQWDAWAPGPVPIKAMLAAGWSWECAGCAGEASGGSAIVSGRRVWCCWSCWLNQRERQLAEAREGAVVTARLRAELQARWPGVTPTDAYAHVSVAPAGAVAVRDAAVRFRFAGCGAVDAEYRVTDGGAARVSIACGDRDAWQAFAAAADGRGAA